MVFSSVEILLGMEAFYGYAESITGKAAGRQRAEVQVDEPELARIHLSPPRVAALSLLSSDGSQNSESVTYSAFLAQITANNVQSVTITDYTVTGVFKTPVLSSDGSTKSTQFTTTVPQFGNSDVIALLQEHHATIDVQSSSGETFWLDLLIYVGSSCSPCFSSG